MPEPVKPTPKIKTPDENPLPKIQIDEEVYDFGSMEDSQIGHHEFLIENVGTAPLSVKVEGTTCKCTKGEIEKERLYPGKKTKLILEWDPKGYTGDFEQTVTISTNDPDPQRHKIKLKVKGRVHAPMAIIPRSVVLGDITNRYETNGTVRLYLFEEPDAKIEPIRFLNSYTESYFSADMEKLSPEDLKAQPDAKAGYAIHVKIKSGMIQGPIRQEAEIVTDSKKLGSIKLPIEGKVVGNISVYGAGWDDQRNLLRLGFVDGRQGVEKNLMVVMRQTDELSEPENLRIASVTPDKILKATLTGSKGKTNKKVTHATLTIEIPPGTPAANYIGSKQAPVGHIILQGDRPDGPRFDLRVSFVIENQ
jgi:hypothetical protein